MAYLVNPTGAAFLSIGGTDYTVSLIDFTASDSSAQKNGFVTTTGTVRLGKAYGGFDPQDYDRNAFRRGQPVILDVKIEGTTVRHPRGHLYVLSTAYDAASEVMEVTVGCQISLCVLTDNTEPLKALLPIPLDPARDNIQGVSSSYQAAGMYLFQDNTGALVANKFFDGDAGSSVAPGAFGSVLGTTVLEASPLAAGSAIPDSINLTYSVPSDDITGDNTGYTKEALGDSYYYLPYPAVSFTRVAGVPASGTETIEVRPGVTVEVDRTDGSDANSTGTGSLSTVGSAYSPPGGSGDLALSNGGRQSSCGNTSAPPEGASGPGSCNEGYETKQQAVYLPARRKTYQITYYDAPGGQVSRSVSDTYAFAVEINNQYYADKFAACRYKWSDGCMPNGNCPYDGMELVLSQRIISTTFYGNANEVTKAETETWETLLSAATTSDWRTGSIGGNPVGFNPDFTPYGLYRSSKVIEEYQKDGDRNVVTQTRYDSMLSRDGGGAERSGDFISALKRGPGSCQLLDRQTLQPTVDNCHFLTSIPNVDCMINGIVSKDVRTSVSSATAPLLPDSVNASTTSVQDRVSVLDVFIGRYEVPPEGAGPYVLEESVPIPLLFDTEEEIQQKLADYEEYIVRWVKGDALGLSIVEALRSDIATNWRPGMPFRYDDTTSPGILAMRMDSCQWAVNGDEALVGFNGIWCGVSNGSISVQDNLQGNTAPPPLP